MADSESGNDCNTGNLDTMTTEGFTDLEYLSDASAHGTEANFIENFKCYKCDICLPYEECIQNRSKAGCWRVPPICVIMLAPPSLTSAFYIVVIVSISSMSVVLS